MPLPYEFPTSMRSCHLQKSLLLSKPWAAYSVCEKLSLISANKRLVDLWLLTFVSHPRLFYLSLACCRIITWVSCCFTWLVKICAMIHQHHWLVFISIHMQYVSKINNCLCLHIICEKKTIPETLVQHFAHEWQASILIALANIPRIQIFLQKRTM